MKPSQRDIANEREKSALSLVERDKDLYFLKRHECATWEKIILRPREESGAVDSVSLSHESSLN